MSKILAACLMMAAQTYSVPPAVLVGIYNVEGGKIGQQVRNTNGTYDLGPMQINTLWLPELADFWNVSEGTAKKWIRDDACTNMGVSAWILRRHLNETGSLGRAIAQYHSRTPHLGSNYRRKVLTAMQRQGLLRPPTLGTGQATLKATPNDRFGKQAKRSAPKLASNAPTTGLKGAQERARLEFADNPYLGSTQRVGINSIVVHNPISRTRD
jgi:hypothetical protein